MSWRWDQGRFAFFQFDELRKIAKFAVGHDLKATTRKPLVMPLGSRSFPTTMTIFLGATTPESSAQR